MNSTTNAQNSTTSASSSRTGQVSRHRSPKQVEFCFLLHVPVETAFELVAVRLPEWFSSIHSVTWDHSRSLAGQDSLGVCSERSCDFEGQALVETIVEYHANKKYSYSVDFSRSAMKMPISEHLGVVEVSPHARGTKVTWVQHFRPNWFVPGALLRWQMREKMMKPALLKLIEQQGGELISVS